MKVDEWYKEFSDDAVQKYYLVSSLNETEGVDLISYTYDNFTRRIIDKESRHLSYKSWLEELASNRIHQVPESTVPFLLSM